jgi:rhodanese-related sulfurtransferase/DNA-binding transcriptional ArsR family regulator
MQRTEAGDRLNEQFARVAKAVAHPKRVELLSLLEQGERGVDDLAGAIGMGVTATSSHLQILRRARLVLTRRDGARVFYRVAGDQVTRFLGSLRDLAAGQLAEVDQVLHDYFATRDDLEAVDMSELWRRLSDGDVVVLDVRPETEFVEGHIPGARSIPLAELESRLAELPPEAEVIAYCRGPFCVLAPEAVAVLRSHGRRARRLDSGVPEWRLAGMPVAVGMGEEGSH